MYICKKHGQLNDEFCKECNAIIQCDCSDTEQKRVKDIIINTAKGEICITLYFTICQTCGNVIDVRF